MKGSGLGICGALPQVVHFPIDDVMKNRAQAQAQDLFIDLH